MRRYRITSYCKSRPVRIKEFYVDAEALGHMFSCSNKGWLCKLEFSGELEPFRPLSDWTEKGYGACLP
jgi:hypothetical protein